MQKVEIVVKGLINQNWSEWFDGFELTHADGLSILKGPVRDQAELRGILTMLADLALELISVIVFSETDVPERPFKGGSEYEINIRSFRQKINRIF